MFLWVSVELSFVALVTRGVWLSDDIDISLILFDGEIYTVYLGDDSWEMLQRVFTLLSR